MEEKDYEQYWHKGGTYIMPVEVFNELFEEMESWKIEAKQLKQINEEHQKLNGILRVQISAREEVCNEQERRINKTIECIKSKFVAQGGFTSYEWNDLLNELLEKLEGEDNDKNR